MSLRQLSLLLLLAGLAAGCSAGKAPHKRGVVPLSELPARHREVWQAYLADDADWIVERERALDDPKLAAFVVDNLVREMVRAYERSRIATTGRAAGPFERSRAELVRFAEHSSPVLVELVRVGDGVVAFLARDVLKEIGARAVPAAAGLLKDRDANVRQRGAELLAELFAPVEGEAEVRERLGELVVEDESWIVRAQSARALGRRGSREADRRPARVALVPALLDADPKVVETAAGALGELGDPNAVPSLIDAYERALGAGDLPALRAALASLRALTGADAKAPEDWRRFWQENRRALLDR